MKVGTPAEGATRPGAGSRVTEKSRLAAYSSRPPPAAFRRLGAAAGRFATTSLRGFLDGAIRLQHTTASCSASGRVAELGLLAEVGARRLAGNRGRRCRSGARG